MTAARFEGTYTALVTPFREDQSIDWDAFDALIDAQLAGGVKGLVPCGTTGESPTLSHEEQLAVIARTVKRAGKRAHVVAGCGSNSTLEATHLTREAHRSGADAVMLVVPYYNRPTQDGLVQHYVTVAREVPCPVVVYNVPGRTGIDLLPDALAKIVDAAPNVVAVKEATGNVLRAQELVRRFRGAPGGDVRRRRADVADDRRRGARGDQRHGESFSCGGGARDGAGPLRRPRCGPAGAPGALAGTRGHVPRVEPGAGEGRARGERIDARRRSRAARGRVGADARGDCRRRFGVGRDADGGATVMRIAVVGARGRMGSTVVRLATEQGLEVVAAIDAGDRMTVLSRSGAEVAIDFSSPGATTELADVAAAAGIAIVSGTTGLDEGAFAALNRAAASVAVAWEPNMSVGVHVLGALVASAIRMLGPDVDVEIVEAHHRLKVDAPSGTALRLAEIARGARGGARFVHGREGRPGAREQAEIGIHAMRGGDVIGEHSVHLMGVGERIELVHRASSRDLFAGGALRVARWIAGREPGRYGMADVLRT